MRSSPIVGCFTAMIDGQALPRCDRASCRLVPKLRLCK